VVRPAQMARPVLHLHQLIVQRLKLFTLFVPWDAVKSLLFPAFFLLIENTVKRGKSRLLFSFCYFSLLFGELEQSPPHVR
jgi:hypothetical protein